LKPWPSSLRGNKHLTLIVQVMVFVALRGGRVMWIDAVEKALNP